MKPKDISIIGGGWSVAGVDLARVPGLKIGVNDSAVRTPCQFAVTMDRLWTEYRWPQLRMALGLGAFELYVRAAAAKNIERNTTRLHVFGCNYKTTDFSEKTNVLNGTNSGMCAFNLAYQLWPERIWLFGFDMCRSPKGEAYWYPPYPWNAKGATTSGKYREWAGQFERAAAKCKARGIEVFNMSPASAITAFPKRDWRSLPDQKELAA